MKSLTILFATFALAASASAFANETATADAPMAANDGDSQDKANKIICKKTDVIGSRMKTKKTCATAAEWAQMRADVRQKTERIQSERYNGNN